MLPHAFDPSAAGGFKGGKSGVAVECQGAQMGDHRMQVMREEFHQREAVGTATEIPGIGDATDGDKVIGEQDTEVRDEEGPSGFIGLE